MIHRMLVGLDGSALAELTLPPAAEVARAFDAELVLMRVLEHDGGGERPVDPVSWRLLHSEAEAYLRRVAAGVTGVTVTTALEEGHAAEQIVSYARTHDVDLVVVGSHGKGGPSPFSLCSTAQKVVTEIGRSVLVVRCDQSHQAALHVAGGEAAPVPPPQRRILVPIDGSRRAEWAVQHAATLARSEGAELVLACVVPVPETPMRPPLEPQDQALVDRLVERGRRWAEHYLADLEHRLRAPDLAVRSVVLVSERVDDTLCRLPAEQAASLVVVSAHGASGEARWPYGSIATRLLTHATVPVLVLQDQAVRGVEAIVAEAVASDSRYVHQAAQ